MADRAANGTSTLDSHDNTRWPPRQIIWSCQAALGILLVRYYLVKTRFFSLYLHKFCTSDEDRALHDHPFSFLTFLFSSGYWEHTEKGRIWRRRFSVLWRPAEFRHRVELVTTPTWTLVLRFQRRREWGFWMANGWMDWRTYGKKWCD